MHGQGAEMGGNREEQPLREAEVIEKNLATFDTCQPGVSQSRYNDLIAVLSHELRTPLAPVITAVQLLEADARTPEEIRERLSIVRRNVELEAKLIGDLLDLTRMLRGKLELEFRPVDVHEKVQSVVQMTEAEIQSKQLRVVLDLDARHRYVPGDQGRIQQVLWNLLSNAIKFTPPGGTIWIMTEDGEDERLRVIVRDTGLGIGPEMLTRIFDAFEQGGREVTRTFGGLGLGLTITKGLVELHGGSIEVHSAGKGKGSTFTVHLPVDRADAESLRPAPEDDPELTETRSCRILLVEDHRDTRRMMSQLLASYGHVVAEAESVKAALAQAQAGKFDLLVCDIGLPDGSGRDLMRMLRAMCDIKGIALSGFDQAEDIRKSQEAGFAEHLTKPVNARHLQEAILRLSRP